MNTLLSRSVVSLTTLLVACVLVTNVQAACPSSKVEVTVVLPSGQTKLLCIPEAALKGLENAAEHSPGRIVTNPCPCFSTEDVDAVAQQPQGVFYCDVIVTDGDFPPTEVVWCSDLDRDDLRGYAFATFFTKTGDAGGIIVQQGWSILNDSTLAGTQPTCQAVVGDSIRLNTDITQDQFEACVAVLGPPFQQ